MSRSHRRCVPLYLEALEDRRVPAGNVISGYVFDDVNGNGLRDTGEAAIASSTIELRSISGVLIGTTTTNASGFYQFDTDTTVNGAVQSQVKTVSFADAKANTIRTQTLPQFDPSLGQLQSIEIKVDGKIISDIKIENIDDEASQVSGAVSGTVLLSGPGFNLNVNIAGNATVAKMLAAYDGVTDYAGTSGVSLGSKTATGSNSQTLSGSSMNAFIGTGTVTLSFLAQATTQASGGGNVSANISSLGGGQITVTYRYLNDSALKPGSYTIKQKVQPAGFVDGRDSQAGVILANSATTDVLNVTLAGSDSINNNFGEYRGAGVSGFVYLDNNNNGSKEAAEQVFANIQIKLTGTDDLGKNVTVTGKTDANGYYAFGNLRPGQYSVTQLTQPKGASPGLLSIGTQGGNKSGRTFNGIELGVGETGNNYNFGHLGVQAPSAGGPYTGKGNLLGSTPQPKPPAGIVINPYAGKGGLLGSTPATPAPASSSAVKPAASIKPTVKPAAGVVVVKPTVKPPAGVVVPNPYAGKGTLLGSTPPIKPPAGIVVNPYAGKGGLLGSTPT